MLSEPEKKLVEHELLLISMKAIAEGTIEWTRDADFGYEVATQVRGIADEDADLLQPRKLYEAHDRLDEYRRLVAKTKTDRAEYMGKWPGLKPSIVDAIK